MLCLVFSVADVMLEAGFANTGVVVLCCPSVCDFMGGCRASKRKFIKHKLDSRIKEVYEIKE